MLVKVLRWFVYDEGRDKTEDVLLKHRQTLRNVANEAEPGLKF